MTTFYVSATGSNSNPGTFASPWQTIVKVESGFGSLITAGDTIRLRAGDLFTGTMLYNAIKTNVTVESYDPITGLPAPIGQTAGIQLAASTVIGSGAADGVKLSNLDLSTTQPVTGAGQDTIIANDSLSICRNWLIKNVVVHGAGGGGITVNNASSTGWTIDSCTISNLGDNGILLNACGGGHLIKSCLIHDVGLFNSAQGRHGIYAKCHDYTITRNEIYNVPNGQAISMRNLGVGSGGISYLNYIHDTPYGIGFFQSDSTTGLLKAFANRIINVSGYGVYAGDAPAYFDTVIANNTIIGTGASIGIDCSNLLHANSTVKNNIVQGGAYAFQANNAALDAGKTITEDYNLFFGQTLASPFKYLTTARTFAAYKAATGQSAHSLFGVDPLLGSPPNYRLLINSPAINAGTTSVTGLSYTADNTGTWSTTGVGYIGPAPDMGATESLILPSSVWRSQPNPTPFAVEALYIDLRQGVHTGIQTYLDQWEVGDLDTRNQSDMEAYYSDGIVIDEVYIDPITFGPSMHIYYSLDDVPDWDYKLWIPINRHYILKKGFHSLPSSIFTKYLKLEFSNLTPRPYNLPEYPALPSMTYNRYPTWVQNYFQGTFIDGSNFVSNFDQVTIDPLTLGFTRPVDRLNSGLSTRNTPIVGEVDELQNFLQGIVTTQQQDKTSLTAIEAKIQFNPPSIYQSDLIQELDTSRALSRVAARGESAWNAEAAPPPVDPPSIQSVPDLSRARAEKQTPLMWFPYTCRHRYQVVSADRPKKVAYYVGIKSLSFHRRDYTVDFDEDYYIETFDDGSHIATNDFFQNDWRYSISP